MTMGISSFYKYVKTPIRYSRQKQFPNEGSQTFWCFASFFYFPTQHSDLYRQVEESLNYLILGFKQNPNIFWGQGERGDVILDRFEHSLTYNLHTTWSFFYPREIWSLRRQVHDRIIFYPERYFFTFSVKKYFMYLIKYFHLKVIPISH